MADIYLLTTNTGSVSWTNSAIWSGGAVPATGDRVYLLNGSCTIDQGLGQSAVLLARLVRGARFSGQVGGTGTNALQVGATLVDLGLPGPDGSAAAASGVTKLALGTNAATVTLYGSGANGAEGLPVVCLSGSNAANALYVLGGVCGLGVLTPAEAVNFPVIGVSGGTLTVGAGASAFTLNNDGGKVTLNAGGNATVNQIAGTLNTQGTFALGSLAAIGGTARLNHRAASGTSVGTLNLQGATVDLSANPAAFAVGTYAERAGALKLFSAGQFTAATVSLDFNGLLNRSVSLS